MEKVEIIIVGEGLDPPGDALHRNGRRPLSGETDMDNPVRKPTRIPKYDYSSENYYFVTICTHEKKCLFGTIKEISRFGSIATDSILEIPSHYSGIRIDKFVVMPNHIHMIVVIGCDGCHTNYLSLNQIVGQYKSGVTRKIHETAPGEAVWQRSFHDHVIRNQKDYEKIWSYIDTNPMRWDKDCFYMEV